MNRKGGTSYREVHERVKSIFIELGTILNESKLTQAIDKIQAIREDDVRDLRATNPHDLVKVLGLSNVTEVGELVLRFLKHRTESRGSVLREDFPYTGNECWLVRTFSRKQANGEIVLWDEPIPEEEWVFRKPVREKILHPFFRALER
jgi:succinate dehydrogenase/fumarate reductase flavoprotein subunit